jgi:hypothetical protein
MRTLIRKSAANLGAKLGGGGRATRGVGVASSVRATGEIYVAVRMASTSGEALPASAAVDGALDSKKNQWLAIEWRAPRAAPPAWGCCADGESPPLPPPPPPPSMCACCVRRARATCTHRANLLPAWRGAAKNRRIAFYYTDDEPRPAHFEARAAHRRAVYAILAFVLPLRITARRYEESQTHWRRAQPFLLMSERRIRRPAEVNP